MTRSLRFLSVVVLGWAGIRASSLGILPGVEVLRIDSGMAQSPPPIVPTEFAPLDPPPAMEGGPGWTLQREADFEPGPATFSAPATARPPLIRASAARGLASLPPQLPGQPPRRITYAAIDRPAFYAPIPTLDDWSLGSTAASRPQRRSVVITPAQSVPAPAARPELDRLQLTAWAMLRGQQGLPTAPPGIATAGTLGGSQAGARLTYNWNRQFAATMRTSSNVGRRGGEVAIGARVRPLAGIPLWVNVERRQQIGRYGGGRNAFALFFEGGVYGRPLPLRFALDAYVQGGVVGFRHRDRFIDGALTMTRPVYRRLSAGLGLWGGAQPGVYRLDAGPRVTYEVRNNIKMHLDYRHRFAGNAQPGSGPVMTLAADF